jgi:2-amino-4-hydroxy-6-hydroxymethyldihydropteridine diphosphokinase
VLSLGSNVGDRVAHLRAAVDLLRGVPDLTVVAVSPVYETAPVGGPAQDDYLNAVVLVETTLSPRELLAVAHLAEMLRDRRRTQRWGPRTLDVDVVDYAGQRLDTDELTLPHPRAAERAFVLQPWLAVDPSAELSGRSVRALLEELGSGAGGGGGRVLLAADALEPQGSTDQD